MNQETKAAARHSWWTRAEKGRSALTVVAMLAGCLTSAVATAVAGRRGGSRARGATSRPRPAGSSR
jgi:hypothetical protein